MNITSLILVLIVVPLSTFNVAADTLFTKNEIVASIPPSGNITNPMELVWGETVTYSNNNTLFITVHREVNQENPESVIHPYHSAAIYKCEGAKYKLLEHWVNSAYMRHPNVFVYESDSIQSRLDLIHITDYHYGTAHGTDEHLFVIENDGSLNGVKWDQAQHIRQITSILNQGEQINKGLIHTLNTQEFSFSAFIWKQGDGNCCPTGGGITGSYALKEYIGNYDRVYELAVKNYRRNPPP